MRAPTHPQQEARLAALRRYGILDTPRESDFDEIVALAARICEAPISVINLIDADRQWFKAEVGLGVRETPLETSICSHVILENDFVEIPDTLADSRMCDNPLCVAENDGLRFYAGALLTSVEGLPLGTLCVLDRRPRQLSDLQRQAIQVLARQVMTQLDLRRALAAERLLRQEIDHRVKNSLSSVAAYVSLERRGSTDSAVHPVLDRVAQQIESVALLHKLLSDGGTHRVDLAAYLQEVAQRFEQAHRAHITFDIALDPFELRAQDAALMGTILNELAANAIKHSGAAGSLRLQVRGTDLGRGRYRLECECDEGSGPTGDQPEDARIGLGMRLIGNAARQLNGAFVTSSENGRYRTCIEVAPASA
jgi:two-component sensor histidine kinase